MIYEKDKLEQYFRDEIERVSNTQLHELDLQIAEIREKKLEEIERQAQYEAGLAKEQELRELQSEYAVRLSRLHDDTDRRLMQKRNELAENVFQEAVNRIEAFTEKEEYIKMLVNKAKILADKGYQDPVIYMREQDLSHKEQILKLFTNGCTIQTDEEIQYGGIRLECLKQGIVIDETFDTAVKEQKEWFYHNSGLFVK